MQYPELFDNMGSLGPSATQMVPVEDAIRQLEPCIFPRLDDGVASASKGQHQIRVSVSHTLPELFAFCANVGAQIPELVKSAWAVTLSSYVGSAEVSFCVSSVAVHDTGVDDHDKSDGLAREISHSICSVAINPDASVGDLFRRVRESNEVNQSLSTHDFHRALSTVTDSVFNTRVLFHDGPPNSTANALDLQRQSDFQVRNR